MIVCNGILDLTLEYDILDGSGTVCHVTAHGTGVILKKVILGIKTSFL